MTRMRSLNNFMNLGRFGYWQLLWIIKNVNQINYSQRSINTVSKRGVFPQKVFQFLKLKVKG